MKHLEIEDAETLADLFSAILKECGTHEAAARTLGISQPHFTRLVRGTAPRRMEYATLQRLEDTIAELFADRRTKRDSLLAKLQAAVLSADAIERLSRQSWWFERMLLRFAQSNQLVPLWRRLRHEYRSHFAAFEQRMAKLGHMVAKKDGKVIDDRRLRSWFPTEEEVQAHNRVYIAELRALEPLVDDEFMNGIGIERTARELEDAGEMKRYLNAALAREAVLLNRLVDGQRARALSKPPLKRGER